MKRFAVRYGETVYQHDGESLASPPVFHEALVANKGRKIPWGNGASSIVDPDDPDSSYHYLVDGVFDHTIPDEVIELVEDTPQKSGVVF